MRDEGYYEKMRDYKNGVWSFMLEHCQILPSGKMRVIFDTDSQDNFEKRVWARYKNIYHRGDPASKQEIIQEKREEFLSKKESRKMKYQTEKRERREKQGIIKKQIETVTLINKLPKWQKVLLQARKKIKKYGFKI